MENELILSKISWDLENGKFFNKDFWVGDKIIYVPCLDIDHFEDFKPNKSTFKNVYVNIYEFKFKAIKKFSHEFSKKCYHYLIELASGQLMFHFNWDREYRDYLQIGMNYWGYGTLSSCGDPSIENPNISSKIIKKIIKKVKIKNIYIGHDHTSWFAKQIPMEDGTIFGEDYLDQMGYPSNYKTFLKNIEKKPWITREITSIKFARYFEDVFFKIQLLP